MSNFGAFSDLRYLRFVTSYLQNERRGQSPEDNFEQLRDGYMLPLAVYNTYCLSTVIYSKWNPWEIPSQILKSA